MDAFSARPPFFHAVLRPNRSLSLRGAVLLVGGFAVVTLAIGGYFAHRGAWPVFGFFGLDVGLLAGALWLNTRAASAVEIVRLDEEGLTLMRRSPSGRVDSITLNPHWARLEIVTAASDSTTLRIVGEGRRIPLAECLGHAERREFAEALGTALLAWRGPRI